MGVCIRCKHYPWVRDADPGLLPVHRCHPSLPARRWTAATVRARNDCPFFEAVEGVEPEAAASGDAGAAAEEEAVEPAAAEPGDEGEDVPALEDAPAEDVSVPEDEAPAEEVPAAVERVWNAPPKPQAGRQRGGRKRER